MNAKIIIERDGAVQRIMFNRPAKKNALDREMYLTMIAALEEAQADPDLRAVLFCGAGGDFTAGNDLSDFLGPSLRLEEFPAFQFVLALAGFAKLLSRRWRATRLALEQRCCSIAISSMRRRARASKCPSSISACRRRLGASLLAPRLFGPARAAQYLMLCESFDAAEAEKLNLVNAVTPADSLLETAMNAARRLAQKPAEAVQATRRLLRGDPAELRERMFEEARLFEKALARPPMRARLEAFFAARRE